MAILTTRQRKNLKASQFADPKNRKFPINDAPRSRNALARISQGEKAGRISKSKASQLRARAQRALLRFSSAARKAKKK